ncbi:hypothetical protein ABVG11_12605 [Streptomyces sp. HD1123-B1]|uniref:hypothetical protein n=1 Tax=Streptomyces huangiella TaxID=3228804 RepID=UPI003D7D14EE
MVAIIRTALKEEEHLKTWWRQREDGSMPRWVTTQYQEHWKGTHVTLIITGAERDAPQVTYVARASKVRGPGDDLKRRVEVIKPYRLLSPVPWAELEGLVPQLSRRYLSRDGALPDGAGRHLLHALSQRASDVVPHLHTLGAGNRPSPALTPTARLLVDERDATLTSVRMTDFDLDELVSWDQPHEDDDVPFVARVQTRNGPSHEDDLIAYDAQRFRDWLGPEDWLNRAAWTGFSQGEQRLVIYNANRKAAEETLGVDLIYYHESRDCFVMVQYKRMSKGSGKSDWRYYPNSDNNLADQLERMRAIDDECDKLRREVDDYRLCSRPSWFKLCQGDSLMPDARSLTPGIYLAREHFDQLHKRFQAPGNARSFSRKTVDRYLDNTEFTDLVAGGWIGTTGFGSQGVQRQLELSLSGSREVVFAAVTGASPSKRERMQRRRERGTDQQLW